MQNQTFKLSLKPNDYPPNVPYIYADQYDEGRTFVATVYDADGSLYNFNGETVTVVGTKPSGTGFSYTATASGNTVTFETTGQMTVVAGNVTCGIIIEKDGDRIGTLHFVLHIQPAALSTDTIIDSDDFGSIITDAVEEWMDEHGIVIDDELETPGAAADAKATGDALNELKSAIDLGSVTPDLKTALLQLASKVAYIDDDGQDYYNDLYDALYNRYWQVTNNLTNCTTSNESVQTIKGAAYSATITASTGYVMTGATVSITMGGNDITATAYSNGVVSIPAVTGALVITISAAAKTVSSISAVYTQSGDVYVSDGLDYLKPDLVVTATYSDATTEIIPSSGYTLSGTLVEGTSTVTASFGGQTATFSVSVTGLFMLREVFTSTKTSAIDTGIKFAVGTTYAICGEFTLTGTTSEVSFVWANEVSVGSTNTGVGLQQQGSDLWGVGVGYSSGAGLAIVNNTYRFVVLADVDNASCNMQWKNVTAGTYKTSSNTYTTARFTDYDNIYLGDGPGKNKGFVGTVQEFSVKTGTMTADEISAYLEGDA